MSNQSVWKNKQNVVQENSMLGSFFNLPQSIQ